MFGSVLSKITFYLENNDRNKDDFKDRTVTFTRIGGQHCSGTMSIEGDKKSTGKNFQLINVLNAKKYQWRLVITQYQLKGQKNSSKI